MRDQSRDGSGNFQKSSVRSFFSRAIVVVILRGLVAPPVLATSIATAPLVALDAAAGEVAIERVIAADRAARPAGGIH
jgi:hypothetical protein